MFSSRGPSPRTVRLLALLVEEGVDGLREDIVEGVGGGTFVRAILLLRSSRRSDLEFLMFWFSEDVLRFLG